MMTIAEQIRHQGHVEGLFEGRAKILLRQLKLRFGPLAQRDVRRVETGTAEQLDHWLERIVEAQSIEDLFGG